MWFNSSGTLRYCDKWVVLDCCPDLGNYYMSLIPKHLGAKPPMYPAHITVVRLGIETPDLTKKPRSGAVVDFLYEPVVKFDGTYWYMDVHSAGIGAVRQTLGLPVFRKPFNCYHLTVANAKEKVK